MVIYKTTNLVNGKQYIGKDTKNKPSYLGSGAILKRAILKYGRENFKKEILESCSSKEELINREEYWLNYYNASNNPMFYNMHNHSSGGTGIRGEHHYMYGKHHSEETKRKMRESHVGHKNHNYGKKFSKETREKLSQSMVLACVRGEKHHMFGKHQSDEVKEKLRKKHIGKKLTPEHKRNIGLSKRGENHPNFKGNLVCIDGPYVGEMNTREGWSKILGVALPNISHYLAGKKYKNGIKGNFLKWEHEL
jgi:group I intron endonuclease